MRDRAADSRGFSLIETVIALGIITIGILSLAGTLALTIVNNNRIQQVTVAKYIAISTIETIIAAREADVLAFVEISSYDAAKNKKGFLLNQRLPVRGAGADGIFGTNDDSGDVVYTIGPNPNRNDGRFDGVNDQQLNLTQLGYSRQIEVTDLRDPDTNQLLGLKQIRVRVFYPARVGGQEAFTTSTIIGDYRTGLTGS